MPRGNQYRAGAARTQDVPDRCIEVGLVQFKGQRVQSFQGAVYSLLESFKEPLLKVVGDPALKGHEQQAVLAHKRIVKVRIVGNRGIDRFVNTIKKRVRLLQDCRQRCFTGSAEDFFDPRPVNFERDG